MFDMSKFYIEDEDWRRAIVKVKWLWSTLANYHEVEQILTITTLIIKAVAHEMKSLDKEDQKLCIEETWKTIKEELPEMANEIGLELAKRVKEALKQGAK